MTQLSRRGWIAASSAFALGCLAIRSEPNGGQAAEEKEHAPLLGFSLYGMKSLPLAESLTQCAAIGYQCVELPLLATWPADSATFSAAAKKDFRVGLAKHRLRLSALMENLPILGDETKHKQNLERLKAAAELAHELSPEDPPLVETVLGGKPAEWEESKKKIVDRLADWMRVMSDAKVRLAIKAHISNAIQQPDQLQWVLEQAASPWLVAAYDYSHFELQKLSLDESLRPFQGRTHFVHVKDAVGEAGKFQFVLPGEGKTKYDELFAALAKMPYRGDILVEVSGQVHSKPGYDPVAAAKKSFAALAPAMKQFERNSP